MHEDRVLVPWLLRPLRDVRCLGLSRMKVYLQLNFIATVLCYTALIKLTIGFPVRTLLVSFLFILLALTYRREVLRVVAVHSLTMLIFIGVSLTGIFLTVISGRGLSLTFHSTLSNVIQPFLIFTTTYVMIRLIGARFVAAVFIGSALLTGGVALLQYLGIDTAWQIRDWLGEFQSVPAELELREQDLNRPKGISLTPIIFSYHIASAYVLSYILYRERLLPGWGYLFLVIAMLAASVANGTRSLVLAILVFEIVTNVSRFQLRSLLWAFALCSSTVVGYLWLQAEGSRVTSIEDTSALGRLALFVFGLRLAADHPLGLGWGFEPGEFAWLYWEHISSFVNSEGVYRLGIHNAFINFFLNYGVFGILAVALVAIIKPRKFASFLFCFSAYFFHSLFHNNGLFLGEYYFWFVFAFFLYYYKEESVSSVAGAAALQSELPTYDPASKTLSTS